MFEMLLVSHMLVFTAFYALWPHGHPDAVERTTDVHLLIFSMMLCAVFYGMPKDASYWRWVVAATCIAAIVSAQMVSEDDVRILCYGSASFAAFLITRGVQMACIFAGQFRLVPRENRS